MAEVTITRKMLKTLKAEREALTDEQRAATKVLVLWDATKGEDGFGVRAMPSGHVSYLVKYWNGKGEKWATLGSYPAVDLEAARKKARELVTAARGAGRGARRDPLEEQKAVERERARAAEELRMTATRANAETMAHHVERWREYLPTHVCGKKQGTKRPISPATLRQYNDVLRRFVVPVLGSLPVHTVTVDDVQRMHTEATKASPYMANRAVAVLSGFFRWLASRKGGRVVEPGFNPAKGDIDLNPELARGEHGEVRLTADQEARLLRAIFAEIEGNDRIGGTALLTLVDSGRRKGEVLGMKWGTKDEPLIRPHADGGATYLLGQSKGITSGDSFYISARALEAIQRLPRIVGSQWVFTGDSQKKDQVGRRADLKSVWKRVKKNAGLQRLSDKLPQFKTHDLRHNRISHNIAANLNPILVAAQSGHKTLSMLRRYAHVNGDDAGRVLAALPVVEPASEPQVVSFADAAAAS